MKNLGKYLFLNKYFFGLILVLSVVFVSFSQNNLPDKPDKETSVYDGANLLSTNQKIQLEQKLIDYADTTSTQIVIVTIKSLNGHNINLYAAEWAHKWGIGQAGKDNGLLFLVAKEDRKMAIQVGYGLEHLLTDAMSRRIIELIIVPHFKNNDYYTGIDAGTTSMMEVLSGEYQNDATESGFSSLFIIIIIFFIVIVLLIVFSNKKTRGGGGNYTTTTGPIILSGGGRTGGFGSGGFGSGGGSFGSGGFSGGFGGGGFGGGGASGGW
jgi:uncharacterized protein